MRCPNCQLDTARSIIDGPTGRETGHTVCMHCAARPAQCAVHLAPAVAVAAVDAPKHDEWQPFALSTGEDPNAEAVAALTQALLDSSGADAPVDETMVKNALRKIDADQEDFEKVEPFDAEEAKSELEAAEEQRRGKKR